METRGTANQQLAPSDIPPPPKKRRPIWPWVVLVAFLLFVVVPIIRVVSKPEPPRSISIVDTCEDLGTCPLSAHDESIVDGLGAQVQRFNAAALPLITDYADPTVSIGRWVRTAGRHIRQMKTAAVAMQADVLSMENEGVRESLLTMSDTLGDEVAAIIELRNAVAHLEIRGERAALRHLQRAADERHQQALEMIDRLRPYMDPEVLQQFLQEAAAQAT